MPSLLLASPAPVIVIEAGAGMGKLVLLAKIAAQSGSAVHHGLVAPPPLPLGLVLWDIPPAAIVDPLPEDFLTGPCQIILAKRPATTLPGLALTLTLTPTLTLTLTLTLTQGRAQFHGPQALLFTAAELAPDVGPARAMEIMAETGGWPLFITAPPMEAPDHWRSPEGIALVGPRYFGYPVDYTPFHPAR